MDFDFVLGAILFTGAVALIVMGVIRIAEMKFLEATAFSIGSAACAEAFVICYGILTDYMLRIAVLIMIAFINLLLLGMMYYILEYNTEAIYNKCCNKKKKKKKKKGNKK